MRKLLLLVILVLFVVALINKNNDEEIRVRIIPNSNSDVDLKIKEECKGIVAEYLYYIYNRDYKACIENINSTINELERILEIRFIEVDVSFSKHTLYNKAYNNNAVKNENHYTLYIILGDGNGDNWWGTVYPDLLQISSEDEIKYESLLVNVINKIKENA